MAKKEYLNELLTSKVLSMKHNDHAFMDHICSSNDEGLKNVCAKVSSTLSDEIDMVTKFLGLSKRSFIEAAIINALAESKEVISEYELMETIQESLDHAEKGSQYLKDKIAKGEEV